MKGWLTVRSGPLLLNSERHFFRLQWGFLSQYESRRSEAVHRYCIHAASLELAEHSRKIVVTIGPLGMLTAHGTDGALREEPAGGRRPFGRRRRGDKAALAARARSSEPMLPAARDKKPVRLVLVADTVEEYRLWALLLTRGRSRAISRRFMICEPVGMGSVGQVFRATAINGPFLEVAVKRLEYNSARGSAREGHAARLLRRAQKEIQTQVKAASRSPYVVKIIDVFFDSRYVYLVMELIPGGSLRQWLEDNGPLEESIAISVAQQLARCILALHQNHIVHRDVKADNVLLELDENGEMQGVRLTDFGFAEVCRAGEMNDFCSTFLGTASYMATEIAHFDKYGAPVDMYALGVLCYVMMTDEFPFDDPGGLLFTLAKIKKADRAPIMNNQALSPDAKSFCLAVTNQDPLKRLTAAASLQHRWIRRGHNVAAGALSSPHMDRGAKAWFRRAFHVISAVHAMRAFAEAPRPQREAVPPHIATERLRMLRRLDSKVHPTQPVSQQSAEHRYDDDGEVFVGDDSNRSLGALLAGGSGGLG